VTLDPVHDQTAVKPSFALRRPANRRGALRRTAHGHEFTSLVLALLQVGGHPRKPTRI